MCTRGALEVHGEARGCGPCMGPLTETAAALIWRVWTNTRLGEQAKQAPAGLDALGNKPINMKWLVSIWTGPLSVDEGFTAGCRDQTSWVACGLHSTSAQGLMWEGWGPLGGLWGHHITGAK